MQKDIDDPGIMMLTDTLWTVGYVLTFQAKVDEGSPEFFVFTQDTAEGHWAQNGIRRNSFRLGNHQEGDCADSLP